MEWEQEINSTIPFSHPTSPKKATSITIPNGFLFSFHTCKTHRSQNFVCYTHP